jgi:NADH:ubiquinone oxidoreductase subunit 5 (subunit L)/multisubunit Na+/H+ antiporter MnhA subunit
MPGRAFGLVLGLALRSAFMPAWRSGTLRAGTAARTMLVRLGGLALWRAFPGDGLLGSLLAVIYVWKVVEVAYLGKPDPDADIREAPLSLLVPTWALVIANLWFGIDSTLTADVATRAAQTLLGVGP